MRAADLPARGAPARWDRTDTLDRIARELLRDGEAVSIEDAVRQAGILTMELRAAYLDFTRQISTWMGLYRVFRASTPDGELVLLASTPADLLECILPGEPHEALTLEAIPDASGTLLLLVGGGDSFLLSRGSNP
jgi:hypothetical protein